MATITWRVGELAAHRGLSPARLAEKAGLLSPDPAEAWKRTAGAAGQRSDDELHEALAGDWSEHTGLGAVRSQARTARSDRFEGFAWSHPDYAGTATARRSAGGSASAVSASPIREG
jgi:hypothetical protein